MTINGGDEQLRKSRYVENVVAGNGYVPGQARDFPSAEEEEFRARMERRKEEVLAERMSLSHPILFSSQKINQAKKNIEKTDWADLWLNETREVADYVISQGADYIEKMIPRLTPSNPYGLTCPNCVGRLTQEGTLHRNGFAWDYHQPDQIRCNGCGQGYPHPDYSESGQLVCPRTGQRFTYYLNAEERADLDDRSGKHAWKWVGHPIHVSFEGVIRERKSNFMLSAAWKLAFMYRLEQGSQYAERAIDILVRFAECYRHWLYHDYWDGVADCDPLYAAWHDMELPLEWKRHPCADAYTEDTVECAGMIQSYWGAGRLHTSTDAVGKLKTICEVYDMTYDADGDDGQLLWMSSTRQKVEKDLILEYVMGAEPFVGGEGAAECLNNKAPRVYLAMAAVGRCLGLAGYVDAALRGYEGLRDKSFLYDGFSGESPAYTNMYLSGTSACPGRGRRGCCRCSP
ncbi:MAG: hypothetical protein ACLFWL_18425 [Candidatus Brocadiia bacterium]